MRLFSNFFVLAFLFIFLISSSCEEYNSEKASSKDYAIDGAPDFILAFNTENTTLNPESYDGSPVHCGTNCDSKIREYAKEGDIIFGSNKGLANPFGHIGILVNNTDGKLWVVEATPETGVTKECRTPECFDEIGKYDCVILLRLKEGVGHKKDIPKDASKWASKQHGEYTYEYYSSANWITPKEWYCSMLVWKAFEDAGQPLSVVGRHLYPPYSLAEYDPNDAHGVAPRDIVRSKDLEIIYQKGNDPYVQK